MAIVVSAVTAGEAGDKMERFDREWFMAVTAAESSTIAV